MIKQFFLGLIFSLPFCISCSQQGSSPQEGIDSSRINSNDTIVHKFFLDPKVRIINLDSQLIYFPPKLNLDFIRNGFDSLQLRIWCDYSDSNGNSDTTKLLVIKRKNSKWYGEIQNIGIVSFNDSLYQAIFSIEKINPKNGWENLMAQLIKLKITTLSNVPEDEEWKKFVHMPTRYVIEIATLTGYRFYYYLTPSSYHKEYQQIKNFDKILNLLNEEIGL